jgi:hypothetical protein
MSAESSLTAVAVVRALLNQDTEGLAVLLPDGLPEPGRELIASLASLAVLSARVAAGPRASPKASTWTGSSGSGRTAPGDSGSQMDPVPAKTPAKTKIVRPCPLLICGAIRPGQPCLGPAERS